LLDLDVLTVTGEPLARVLDWWQACEHRRRVREMLHNDGVDPDAVIYSPLRARERGLTSTVCFPRGNLVPDGSVIKATAIDPSVVDAGGVYRHEGPAKVFTTERAAISAIKNGGVAAGDVLVLCCRGPMGAGMEEIYQVTAALKHLPWGKHVAVLTDARFSGVSTGACIGHLSPEALAGGPIGKLRDGDRIRIVIDRHRLEGTVDFVGDADDLAKRQPRGDLFPDPNLHVDTKLWAALQQASGGVWGGCVYDADAISRQISLNARSV
jgi:dihydroxyacid dehydratase/phosphogluconate dehydratase